MNLSNSYMFHTNVQTRLDNDEDSPITKEGTSDTEKEKFQGTGTWLTCENPRINQEVPLTLVTLPELGGLFFRACFF